MSKSILSRFYNSHSGAPTPAGPPISLTDLLGYYTFDSNGLDQNLSFDPSWTIGLTGNYGDTPTKFNGAVGSTSTSGWARTKYIEGATAGVDTTGSASSSIGGWFYAEGFNAGNSRLFQIVGDAGWSSEILLTGGTGANLRIAKYTGSNSDHTVNFSVGNWYHIFYTQSGTTANIYVNGATAGTNVSGSGTLGDAAIRFGFYNRLALDQGWIGTIDDCSYWKRALTFDEILTLYTCGTPLIP